MNDSVNEIHHLKRSLAHSRLAFYVLFLFIVFLSFSLIVIFKYNQPLSASQAYNQPAMAPIVVEKNLPLLEPKVSQEVKGVSTSQDTTLVQTILDVLNNLLKNSTQ